MCKYQYDDAYFVAVEDDMFIHFLDYEDEEAFARYLEYGKYQ
jgi:hypothetical protein